MGKVSQRDWSSGILRSATALLVVAIACACLDIADKRSALNTAVERAIR
jgi:hypothetical protein